MNEKKVKFFSSIILLVFLIIIVKLFYIQIWQRDKLIKYIENQYYSKKNILLPRGKIYDKKGNILAISIPTITVYAIGKYIKNKELLAEKLSPVLKMSKQYILKKLNSENYVVIARNLDKSLADKIEKIRKETKEWNLGILESSKRVYPFGKIGGANIGFVNKYTGKGQEGLERKFNSILGGGYGKILFMRDAVGNPITIISKEKNESKDVVLTIDSNIQYMAEEALKKLVKLRKPKEALVLIMNPKTGEILANAVYPSFDPNHYSKYKYNNITFRSAYEIGSLAKPFVVAEALDLGVVKEGEIIDGRNGIIYVDGQPIKDHRRFGKISLEDVIIHSSNVGAIDIALRIPTEKFYKIFKEVGFGQKFGAFPGESKGILREYKRDVDKAYFAIGQNWIATPIQVAVAYSAIANGGYVVKPTFLKEIKDKDKIEKNKPVVLRKVFSNKSLKWLKKVLTLVVEEGTGHKGKSKYYTIAGKTGTAQKYDPKTKKLSDEKFNAWFAGFFPVENPKYTIVIFANEPKKIKRWEQIGGGAVSSVVLKELIDRLMFYSKVKPDKN
ncbi:peptidoglycan D,D-transpeptidase FtsI family protein [Hydrogenothermus marinus]|uniref:Cell division protein FtsI (Penicillin-binding protein 3) n=1 Tax=Hydrogenothermus marinus TaxID=133270 RepID=A0A3M0BI68_9AQUI|nr:penicillin-binding protein 2 [Hydrogenothermus marinus]RMA96019.1 cell division protein FtsI (penicillin-binding protein 3) [Hydrogenothermus marinus]